MKNVHYIGLDVHKETIVIATAAEGRQPAREFKTIPSDYTRLLKTVRLLTPKGGGVALSTPSDIAVARELAHFHVLICVTHSQFKF